MGEKTFTFYGTLKSETAKCWFVNDGVEDIPIPKSQVRSMRLIRFDDYEFEVPEWLAKEKGIM